MARSPQPTPFSAGVQPILPDGANVYIQRTVQNIADALFSTQRMTPTAAKKAPRDSLDGMMRLARYPWWPVVGQAADAWVYYDAAGGVWRDINTAPTSTH